MSVSKCYEELRALLDGGSESMTHNDAKTELLRLLEQDIALHHTKDFATWFEAQHGRRPGGQRPSWEVAEDLAKARYECSRLEALYRAQELYDEQRKSALYAWQAKEAA